MKIAVIGVGNVGGSLADRLQQLGHQVTIAARDPQSPTVLSALIQNPNLLVQSPLEAMRSIAKKPLLESLNPDHIIVTGEEDLQTRVLEITQGRGVDFVWDAVGGKDFPKLADITAPGGQINIYGGLDLDAIGNIPMPWFQMIGKGIAIRGYTLFELTYNPDRFGIEKPYDPVAYHQAQAFILSGLQSGK